MNKIDPLDITHFQLTGEGSGTGYYWYFDLNTGERVIDVYKNGELYERHRARSKEEMEGIVEKIKNV